MDGALERNGFLRIPLPAAGNVVPGWRDGRNIAEGYQRGVALEYGNITPTIEAHPLFRKAVLAVARRSLLDYRRLQNLFLILTMYLDKLPSQNIIEFGSYKGGSLIFMGTLLKELYPDAKLYGLDTFEGMPVTDFDIDLHKEGDFDNTSVEQVQEAISDAGLDNVILVKGLVENTFPSHIPEGVKFGLAHIDLDIYHPIKYAQNTVYDFMEPGGYLVYDDATASTCIGATQAVEDLIIERQLRSEQIFPHFVFRKPLTLV